MTTMFRAVSFQVSIRLKGQKTWAHNGLRFADAADANAYGVALKARWPVVEACQVEPTEGPANCTYPVPSDRYPVDRQLESAEEVDDGTP